MFYTVMDASPIPDVNPDLGWPAAIVLVAFLLGPSILSFMANKNTKAIKKSITTNNGGNSVKDRFDRLERKFDEHIEWSQNQSDRIDRLERKRARFPFF